MHAQLDPNLAGPLEETITLQQAKKLIQCMAHEHSFLLLAPPGVGKSETVYQAAQEAGLPCRSLLGTQIAPEDVSGVPRIVGERSVFCPPRLLLPEKPEPFCLFLRWIESVAPGDRTFNRPSRREAERADVVLPGRRREGWILNVVLDTSGSMTDEIPPVLGTLAEFCDAVAVDQVRLVQCDAAVTSDELVDPHELAERRIEGYGGSDLSPALRHLADDQHVRAVVAITDREIAYLRVTGLATGPLWGTDVYTGDSAIAAAAVHAGLLKAGETAVVKVTVERPLTKYQGSVRNGVTSQDYGQYGTAYRLAGV